MARQASVDWSFGGLPDEAPALRFKRSSTPLVSRSPFVPPQAYSLMGRIEIVYGGALEEPQSFDARTSTVIHSRAHLRSNAAFRRGGVINVVSITISTSAENVVCDRTG